MNKATRKTVIAGNWKTNMTPSSTKAFITELAPMVAGKDGCDIVLCVPFVDIAPAVEAAKGTNIKIGAENVHFARRAVLTPATSSADMLNEVGAEYAVIGHSERRQYFARDQRDCQPPREGGSRGRTQGHPLRRRASR